MQDRFTKFELEDGILKTLQTKMRKPLFPDLARDVHSLSSQQKEVLMTFAKDKLKIDLKSFDFTGEKLG